MVATSDFQPGDVIGFSGRSLTSRLIKAATVPPWYWFRAHWRCVSHVAICCELESRDIARFPNHLVFHRDGAKLCLLVESTTLEDLPCLLKGTPISGVQVHYPVQKVRDYPGFVYRMRIAPEERFSPEQSRELTQFLLGYIGRPYDRLEAVDSATPFVRDRDGSRTFCSKVVAKALMHVGLLGRSNPGEWTPAELVKELSAIDTYQMPVRLK